MNRPVLALIGAVALALGIGIGIGAGFLSNGTSNQPVAVVSSPTAAPPASAGVSAEPEPSGSTPGTSEPPSAEPTATAEPTPIPSPTPELVPAPLTGRPVTKAVAAKHVIAVMIDDQFRARPQSGLSQADVVFQAPAEGGIPRYMALFQSTDPAQVGPIRSSRLYFIAWASPWKSVYAHVGGSPQAMSYLQSKGHGQSVYNADEFRWAKYLYRVKWRAAPHNVYTDAKNIRKLAKAVGSKAVPGQAPIWKFAPGAPLEQRPKGSTITVPYLANRIQYAYDRATNTYLRTVSVEGKQYDKGRKGKVRIAPTNVVVMKVSFVPIGDKKHRLDGQVTGSGQAWISTNGITTKGTWRKKSFTSPLLFYGPDGKQVTLSIGQTFVQVVPRTTTISFKNGKVPAASASPIATPTPSPKP